MTLGDEGHLFGYKMEVDHQAAIRILEQSLNTESILARVNDEERNYLLSIIYHQKCIEIINKILKIQQEIPTEISFDYRASEER